MLGIRKKLMATWMAIWTFVKGIWMVIKRRFSIKVERWAILKLFEQIETKRAIRIASLAVVVVAYGYVCGVVAANETQPSVNWTAIGDIIEGAGSIMPSVGSLITAIIPVLLLLIVVGFVTGLFDSIIGAISDAFRFFRR